MSRVSDSLRRLADDDNYEVPEVVTKVKKLNEDDDDDAKPKAAVSFSQLCSAACACEAP